VAIVGGTHGNERHGVHMVRHYLKDPSKVTRDSFKTMCLIGNPASVDNKGTGAGTRYVDQDLNRCFPATSIYSDKATALLNVEERRAREVDLLLGPKDSRSPVADFIFDLHNTTSNTGILLCFHPDDSFALRLAAFLHSKDPSIVMCLWPSGDRGLLPTVGRGGMTVEIGPLAHSTVNAKSLLQTMELIERALDFIDEHNTAISKGTAPPPLPDRSTLPLFKGIASLDYPRCGEEPTGFIHPNLQGISELQPGSIIKAGDPVFLMIDGSTQNFEGKGGPGLENVDWTKDLYPMFVNEAAYYEQGCACALAQKCSW